MKIPPRNIEAFVKSPSAGIGAVLLYGPDEGLIRERMSVMSKHVVVDINDPFNVCEFTAAQLSDKPSLLLDEAMSISMLGGRKVIRLRDASDKFTAIIKDTLAVLTAESNFILIDGGELPARSTLRALFENAENAAALPCYVEDTDSISRVISSALKATGYNISSEAITCIAANVVGDRAIARSEVEKLITYMGETNKNITLDDVTSCIGNSADLPLDDIAQNVASGQFAAAERILSKVISEGVPAVSILRNLQNYFMRLHLSKARIASGEDIELALKKLKPPLFFKVKPAFTAQLNNWSLNQLEQAISMLVSAEAKCKQTNSNPEILCGRVVLSLAQIGVRAFGSRRRA